MTERYSSRRTQVLTSLALLVQKYTLSRAPSGAESDKRTGVGGGKGGGGNFFLGGGLRVCVYACVFVCVRARHACLCSLVLLVLFLLLFK
jgi:hypothetical protein